MCKARSWRSLQSLLLLLVALFASVTISPEAALGQEAADRQPPVPFFRQLDSAAGYRFYVKQVAALDIPEGRTA